MSYIYLKCLSTGWGTYPCPAAWRTVHSDWPAGSLVSPHLPCWPGAAWPPSASSAPCWSCLSTGGCHLHAALRTCGARRGEMGEDHCHFLFSGRVFAAIKREALPFRHAGCSDLVDDDNLFGSIYGGGQGDPQVGRGALHYLHQQRARGLLHGLWIR